MERRFPSCFLSCSFSAEDAALTSWFERILIALEFDPRKADAPQPRPPPEKIAEMIQAADCFVAIVTRRTKVEGNNHWVGPDWVQNEIGMAYQAGKPMAIFVEDGVDLKGIGPWAADYVSFTRSDLGASTPNVVTYLVNLVRSVTRSRVGRAEDVPTARALMNELLSLATIVEHADKPIIVPWQLAFATARFTGRFYMLPSPLQNTVTAGYAAIDEFDELVKPSFTLRKVDGFAPDKAEAVKIAKVKVRNVVGQAVIELLQFAYPEEWGVLVDAIKQGKLSPSEPG